MGLDVLVLAEVLYRGVPFLVWGDEGDVEVFDVAEAGHAAEEVLGVEAICLEMEFFDVAGEDFQARFLVGAV